MERARVCSGCLRRRRLAKAEADAGAGAVADGGAVLIPADGFMPGDFFNDIYTDHINVSRSLIRVRQGKGRKDRFTLLSKPLIKKLTEYRELYKPQEWLFERLPGEQFTESIVSKRLKAAAQEAGITKRIYPHLLRTLSPHTLSSKAPT